MCKALFEHPFATVIVPHVASVEFAEKYYPTPGIRMSAVKVNYVNGGFTLISGAGNDEYPNRGYGAEENEQRKQELRDFRMGLLKAVKKYHK